MSRTLRSSRQRTTESPIQRERNSDGKVENSEFSEILENIFPRFSFSILQYSQNRELGDENLADFLWGILIKLWGILIKLWGTLINLRGFPTPSFPFYTTLKTVMIRSNSEVFHLRVFGLGCSAKTKPRSLIKMREVTQFSKRNPCSGKP